jgi:hypothetical protein
METAPASEFRALVLRRCAGGAFLLPAVATGLWAIGILGARMIEVAVPFALIAGCGLLAVSAWRRLERFKAVPPGTRMDTWVEGTVARSSKGLGRFLLLEDAVRVGVESVGLRIRRRSDLGHTALEVFLGFLFIAQILLVFANGAFRSADHRLLFVLGFGVAFLATLLVLLFLDPIGACHEEFLPWSNVARIVETKEGLTIHQIDGSAPMRMEFPFYSVRRILPQVAGNAPVEVFARGARGALATPLQRWPASIDERTAAELEDGLEALRRARS